MRWKRSLVLLAWLVGILFPMAWLGEFSSRFLKYFDALFSPEWMHWVMHAFLYTCLAILVGWIFALNSSWKTLRILLIVGLVIGMIQEGMQILAGVQIIGWNTLLDLGVDSLGVLIGFGAVARTRKHRADKELARR